MRSLEKEKIQAVLNSIQENSDRISLIIAKQQQRKTKKTKNTGKTIEDFRKTFRALYKGDNHKLMKKARKRAKVPSFRFTPP